MITCYNASGQFLPSVSVFKGIKNRNLTVVYHQGQKCPRNRNLRTFVLYQLIAQVVRGAYSQKKAFRESPYVICGHTFLCSFYLLLHTVVQIDKIFNYLHSHCIHALQPLGKCFRRTWSCIFLYNFCAKHISLL
jgi:hypothetical protein